MSTSYIYLELLVFSFGLTALFLMIYYWMYRRQKRLPDNWDRKEANENLAVLCGGASLVMFFLTVGFFTVFWLFIIFFPALFLLLSTTGYHWYLAWKINTAIYNTPEAIKNRKINFRLLLIPSVTGVVFMMILTILEIAGRHEPVVAVLFFTVACFFVLFSYHFYKKSR